ncbi:hypothetical protein SAMN05216490_2222 [Mucilaginibacter mallensis]|uniref:Nucleotidyltransferase domain-containing protein n=1 Tax=Mucilaginibacter mallensis TaxID=652787 RepID=A0A1H1WKT8_MUCMA|nr:hypothetical protein SAMN05216490_2222 [Mucilaginibacter mallensis]
MITAFNLIRETLHHNSDITGPISAFAFGSATRPDTKPNDMDLLIVYHEAWQPELIRQLLRDIHLPIHLIFMLPDEQIETNFIALQECIALEF